MESNDQPDTASLFAALDDILAGSGIEPRAPKLSNDEVHSALTDLLGAKPAREVEEWFRFAERWSLCMIAPLMIGLLDVESAANETQTHAVHTTPESVYSSLLTQTPEGKWDAVAVGAESSGAVFVLSPATQTGAETDAPRLCLWDFGDVFFFPGDQPSNAKSVKERTELPTGRDWLRELVRAHSDGRIISDGQQGFMRPEVDDEERLPGEYPWPLTATPLR